MKVVFLDKDGTLIEDLPYKVDPNRIRLMTGAASGLAKLVRAGYSVVIVSNQSGIARGYFDEQALIRVWAKIQSLVKPSGGVIADFLYCPHHPAGTIPAYAIDCACRKPKPGLLFKAARRYPVNFEASWMIGDILDDVEAGNRAGCRTILINNGNETEWQLTAGRQPSYLARNLEKAADLILSAPEMEEIGPVNYLTPGENYEIRSV